MRECLEGLDLSESSELVNVGQAVSPLLDQRRLQGFEPVVIRFAATVLEH